MPIATNNKSVDSYLYFPTSEKYEKSLNIKNNKGILFAIQIKKDFELIFNDAKAIMRKYNEVKTEIENNNNNYSNFAGVNLVFLIITRHIIGPKGVTRKEFKNREDFNEPYLVFTDLEPKIFPD